MPITLAKFFIQLGRVDELGSGVLNVNRLIKKYTDKGKVQFIEGNTFKTIVLTDTSIHGGTIGGTIGGAIKSLEEKPAALLKAIASNQGERAPYYKETLAMSERSIDRYLQQLKELGLIEFKGDANQTGGYFLRGKAKV